LRSTFLEPNGLEHPRSGIACNNPFAFHTLIRGQTLSSLIRNVNLDTGFCRGGVPITAGCTASRSSCNNMAMDSVALTFISPPRRGPPVAQQVKTPSPKSAVPIAPSDEDRVGRGDGQTTRATAVTQAIAIQRSRIIRKLTRSIHQHTAPPEEHRSAPIAAGVQEGTLGELKSPQTRKTAHLQVRAQAPGG
jgi:hypothetical protein